MRMTRDIIALILALAMLMPFGVSAEVTTAVEATAEVADPGVDLLVAIGVVEDEEAALMLDSYMTRAEFSMILCRLRGYDTMGQGMFGENYFTDVAEDSYEKGYIAAAVTTGLMDPVGDKLLHPIIL